MDDVIIKYLYQQLCKDPCGTGPASDTDLASQTPPDPSSPGPLIPIIDRFRKYNIWCK